MARQLGAKSYDLKMTEQSGIVNSNPCFCWNHSDTFCPCWATDGWVTSPTQQRLWINYSHLSHSSIRVSGENLARYKHAIYRIARRRTSNVIG